MKSWYLLYCKSGFKYTVKRLEELQVDVYQPMIIKVTPRTDCHGVRTQEKPFFNNYLFVAFDINVLHTTIVSEVPGAIGLVRFGTGPCIIPQIVIDSIECANFKVIHNHDGSIECKNTNPVLLEEIQHIASISSQLERMTAFTRMLETIS